MNYSDMSDFEINCAVSKALGFDRPALLKAVLSGEYFEGEKFDPCNSWADAGPIIQENRICIFADGEEPCSLGSHGGHQWWNAGSDCRAIQWNYQSNPLRAAMIVFLMMKEADNG